MQTMMIDPRTRPSVIPGSKHVPLCQWDGHSCGGCCNDFTRPREVLKRVFLHRREVFPSFELSPKGLADYQARMGLTEKDKECKFLSFLDDEASKVGCLIHPKRVGAELRDAGSFGSDLCAGSFCQAAIRFELKGPDPFLKLQATGSDWYDYSRLFSRYFQADGAIGLLFVLEGSTQPLAQVLLAREVRLPRGLTDYGLLLARLLGLKGSEVFRPGTLDRLAGVSELPPEAIEDEVARFLKPR
jgi:hypothetical protein